MHTFHFHLSYVATLPEKTLTTKMNDSACLPVKSVSGSENQQRSIAIVQNDGL